MMKQQLSTLTCFNHVEAIVPIVAGLSSDCYQVYADNKTFFAKKVTSANEVIISRHAGSQNLSPTVIYHDQDWLINEFIIGENLALTLQSIDEKIVVALKLMVKCHQMTVKPITLAPKKITDELIDNACFSTAQKAELLQTAQQLIPKLHNTKNHVCCHGDLNFSNILIGSKKNTYLVDFECACTAPTEYDLAMFIAVNAINKNQITTIVAHYKKYALVAIDLTLLSHYLRFCYFINGLWYTHAYHQTKLAKFSLLAKQQWSNIQC